MKQRPIKFRAIREDNGKWIEGSYVQYVDFKGVGSHLIYFSNGHPNDVLAETVGQYTGLHDKNGKEVWEGDIVRILYTDWASKSEGDPRTLKQYLIDIASVGKVVYNPPTFEIDFGPGKWGDNDYARMNPGPHGYIEVIGDIYSNPELLDQK